MKTIDYWLLGVALSNLVIIVLLPTMGIITVLAKTYTWTVLGAYAGAGTKRYLRRKRERRIGALYGR